MYSVGVDLGGTLTKLALVSDDGRILAHRREATLRNHSPQSTFSALRRLLESMTRECGLPYPPPGGCGVGVPGVVDASRGWLRLSGPLGWEETDLAAVVSAELDCDVALDNDVNAGALADLFFGEAMEANDIIYIGWGTGIGAALVVNRSLYHTRGGAMGNFGHMPADPASERLCYCGCRGCLEIEAGGAAMVDKVRQQLEVGESSILAGDPRPISPERIAAAAAAGDLLSQQVLHRSAVLMARALAGVLAFLNPDTVVFGGGVSKCFPVICELFQAELRRRTPGFSLRLTRVVQSRFGENSGVVGAALLPKSRRLR